MIFTQNTKHTPHWGTLIKRYRNRHHLSKAAFGRLFGVTGEAVHYWESGKNDPPGSVTWWVYKGGKLL